MKFPRAFILILLVVATGAAQGKESSTQATIVAGTRVSLKPPSGFTLSPQFSGYWLESHDSSLIVTEFPGSFREVSFGFSSPTELAARGLSLLSKQEIEISGLRGLLLQVTQTTSSTDYLKWIVVFGDDKESVMIAATFPKKHEHELSQKMRGSILTATWNREQKVSPTEGLNFTFTEIGELKLAKRIANSLVFTKGGIFPSKAIDDPIFLIGQSIGKIEANDLEQFAISRVSQTASVSHVEIEQSDKVTVDNLSGHEIVAKGKDIESGQAMVIYQMILFEDQRYYIMQGLISGAQRQTYLTAFKEMARLFRRKPLRTRAGLD